MNRVLGGNGSLSRRRASGFSYIEVVVAMTIFSVLLMAALPILAQAGRNLEFAARAYEEHLAAQGIMLIVRDELPDISAAETAAFQYAERVYAESFGVWILRKEPHADAFFGTPNAAAAYVNLDRLGEFAISEDIYVIVVAVWDAQGNLAGRAIGVG